MVHARDRGAPVGARPAKAAGRVVAGRHSRHPRDPVDVPAGQKPPVVGPAGAGDPPAPEITYRPRRWLLLIPLGVLVVWSLIAHQRVIAEAEHIPVTALAIWGVTFATVGGQVILSWLGRPYTCPEPPGLTVAVIIPCYNEDIPYAERVLASLRAQTRKADQIIVVDDGSTKVDYAAAGLPQAYPEAQWLWQPENRGKKHAQVAGWCQAATTDVICTIDSDSALERQDRK